MILKYSKCLLWLAYVYFTYLLFLITIQYIPFSTDVAFLRIKQEVIVYSHYKFAFFTHVYTSIFLMIFGAFQFSEFIRKKYLFFHRVSGRIYVIVLLLFSGPSGLIMSYYANGGVFAQISFILLSLFWMTFTFLSYFYIKKGAVQKHQKFAIRSFALTVSAISLRLVKFLLVYFFEPLPMDAYRIAAWSGWVLNLLLAELFIYYKYRNHKAL